MPRKKLTPEQKAQILALKAQRDLTRAMSGNRVEVKGAKGDTGAQGPRGKQGEQGPKGDTGDTGVGLKGKDGKNGVDGRDGKDGKDGKNGKDGKKGKDGSPDSAKEIRNKLESLEGKLRLDASAISNLDKAFKPELQSLEDILNARMAEMPSGFTNKQGIEALDDGIKVGSFHTVDFVSSGSLRSEQGILKVPLTGGGGGGGNPGTPLNSIQYNDNGSFGGDSSWAISTPGTLKADSSGTLLMTGNTGPIVGNGEATGGYKMMIANSADPSIFGYDIDDKQWYLDNRLRVSESFDVSTSSDSERSEFDTTLMSSSDTSDNYYALRSRLTWENSDNMTAADVQGSAGFISSFRHEGSGNITSAMGSIGFVETTKGGSVDLAAGVVGAVLATDDPNSKIVTGAAFRAFSLVNTGQIDNVYGMYIKDGDLAGTTNYGLYFEQDAPSYHEGDFWVGLNSSGEKFHVTTTSHANGLAVRDSNGRIAMSSNQFSAQVNIGGAESIRFDNSGLLFNVAQIDASSSGVDTMKINTEDLRIGGDLGGRVNIKGADNNEAPLVVREGDASITDILTTWQDNSANNVIGITVDGGFYVIDSNLEKRYVFQHSYQPSPVDGITAGISLEPENGSGNVHSAAYMEAYMEDISAHQARLDFGVKDDSSATSSPDLIMSLTNYSGNASLDLTGTSLFADINLDAPGDARIFFKESGSQRGRIVGEGSDNSFRMESNSGTLYLNAEENRDIILGAAGGDTGVGLNIGDDPYRKLEVAEDPVSGGATTVTATAGANTFTTSVSVTLKEGMMIIPDGDTSNVGVVETAATGTNFTIRGSWASNVVADTYTIQSDTTFRIQNGFEFVRSSAAVIGFFRDASPANDGGFILAGGSNNTQGASIDLYGISYTTNPGQMYLSTGGEGTDTGFLQIRHHDGTTYQNHARYDKDGQYRLGSGTPSAFLDIVSPGTSDADGIRINSADGDSRVGNIYMDVNGQLTLQNDNDNVTIDADELQISGTTLLNVNSTAGSRHNDTYPARFGTNSDYSILYSSANDSLQIVDGMSPDTNVRFELFSTGAVSLDEYGDGTFTGTATYGLGVDTDGNIIETSVAGAMTLQDVTDNGSVTTNAIEIQNTGGITINPGSDTDTDLISVDVTGSPTFSWDESSDAFFFTGSGIVHSNDGNGDLQHVISGATVTSQVELHSEGATELGGLTIHRHSNANNFGGHVLFMKSAGSHASPTIVTDGDILGRTIGLGYDGTDYEPAAEMQFLIDGTPGNNDMPGEIAFFTNAGSQSLTKRMNILANGNVGIATTGASFPLHVTGSGDVIGISRTAYDTYTLRLSAGDGLAIHNSTDARDELRFNGEGDIIMNETTGSTMIGLTTPTSSRLDVKDTALATGNMATFRGTVTTPNAGDVGLSVLQVDYNITANSATNNLVTRAFELTTTNALTGGGAEQNMRAMNITHSTSASTTTTSLNSIYIANGTSAGTVTNQYGMFVASMQGTNNYAIYDNVGTTWYGAAGTEVGIGVQPTSTLHVDGSVAYAYVEKTANYTLTSDDNIVNCTANTFTLTLPTASGIAGRVYRLKNTGGGTVTVATTGAETIDGAASVALGTNSHYTLASTGSNWIVLY